MSWCEEKRRKIIGISEFKTGEEKFLFICKVYSRALHIIVVLLQAKAHIVIRTLGVMGIMLNFHRYYFQNHFSELSSPRKTQF